MISFGVLALVAVVFGVVLMIGCAVAGYLLLRKGGRRPRGFDVLPQEKVVEKKLE